MILNQILDILIIEVLVEHIIHSIYLSNSHCGFGDDASTKRTCFAYVIHEICAHSSSCSPINFLSLPLNFFVPRHNGQFSLSSKLKWAFREFFKYLHCIATANRTTIALMMPISTSSTSADFKKCCHQQIQSNQMVLEERIFHFPKNSMTKK